MQRRFAAAALAGLAFAGTPEAGAQQPAGVTMKELVDVFEAAGIPVESGGAADVRRVGGALMRLTECENSGRCSEIQFSCTYADVSPTMGAVNDWNWKFKIPEASLSGDGALHLEMWLTARGATPLSIVDSLTWFDSVAENDYWRAWKTAH